MRKITVQDVYNAMNDDFTSDAIIGVNDWDVYADEGAYTIEVVFEDYSSVKFTIFKDESFESRIKHFVEFINSQWEE